mmetsp:Transcript_6934/g.12814  ORF Transcript_6934/g.12814 Transcript_6934/m.12814 type:complete len:465 (-) Transcript_6934:38-1432(-)
MIRVLWWCTMWLPNALRDLRIANKLYRQERSSGAWCLGTKNWLLMAVCFVFAVIIALLGEHLVTFQVPSETAPWSTFRLSLTENPVAKPSKGVTIFSVREFSRVCCDYGATVYRLSKGFEVSAERGVYSYRLAFKEYMKKGEDKAIVFVPIADLKGFIDDFFLRLPRTAQITLVTGQEDSGPLEAFGYGRSKFYQDISISFHEFLEDNRLHYWFTQNYDIGNCLDVPAMGSNCVNPTVTRKQLNKIGAIPLGIDFHTTSEKVFRYSKDFEPPLEQQKLLLSISKLKFKERKPKIVSLFTADPEKPDREQLLERSTALASCVIQPKAKMNRNKFWKLTSEFAFIFAPQGNGIDTHRVYESLSLGTVPIVRSSPLDKLYEQYPITIVKDWAAIESCDQIETWRQEIISRFGEEPFANPEVQKKLRLAYWKDLVTRVANSEIRSIKMRDLTETSSSYDSSKRKGPLR